MAGWGLGFRAVAVAVSMNRNGSPSAKVAVTSQCVMVLNSPSVGRVPLPS